MAKMKTIAIGVAERLWGMPVSQMAFGPPNFKFRHKLAWVLYHWAINK